MSVTHELKIQDEYYEAIERGEKTFEVRRDDRGFQKGDTLLLKKLGHKGCSNRHEPPVPEIECKVLWILTGGQHGIEPGYIVMSIEPTNSNKEVGE